MSTTFKKGVQVGMTAIIARKASHTFYLPNSKRIEET